MTPEHLMQRFKKNKNKEPKKNRKWSNYKLWFGAYAVVVSTILASVSISELIKPKKHDLTIYVADIRQTSDGLEFIVGYYNDGDFIEVVSRAEAILGQAYKGYSEPLPWQQGECFKPLIISPKKSEFRIYKSDFDFNADKLNIFKDLNTQTFVLTFDFDVLNLSNGIVKERLKVGILKTFENQSKITMAQIDFMTTKQKVNFENAKPRITKLTSPVEKEFLSASICTKKT